MSPNIVESKWNPSLFGCKTLPWINEANIQSWIAISDENVSLEKWSKVHSQSTLTEGFLCEDVQLN